MFAGMCNSSTLFITQSIQIYTYIDKVYVITHYVTEILARTLDKYPINNKITINVKTSRLNGINLTA